MGDLRMIPAQEIREWLILNQQGLQSKLGLDDWIIDVKVSDKKAAGDSETKGKTIAEVTKALYQYRSAKIIIYAVNTTTIEHLFETLVHECLHIVLAPFEHAIDLLQSKITDPAEHNAIDEYVSMMRELTIWELEQTLKAWSK